MKYAIQAEGINKTYGKYQALTSVSIDIPEGKIFGLLGPNGAGKTTLIRILNQIIEPDSGLIKFYGSSLQRSHVENIGYLPEERGLYKKMKVGEQCVYLAQMKGMKEKDALAELKMWFEKFEIQEWWNKTVEDLSKGMAQKIQFITTVVHKPKLLILDEPFSGFDPINAELIRNEMLRLRDEGTTIVLSTHDMGSVESLCDNIALINRSHVILSGSVAEVRDSFRTKTYTLKFEGTLLEFTIALGARFELMSNELINDIHTVTVRIKPEFKLNDLLKQIIPVVDILSAEENVPSMHDIFVQSVLSFNEAQA